MNGLSPSLSSEEQTFSVGQTRVPESVLDWGLELRLWVTTCVCGLSIFSARALGLQLSESTASGLGIVFFATLALYNLDGSLDARHRFEPGDFSRSRRHKGLHLALTCLSCVPLCVLGRHLSVQALILTGGGVLLCGSYVIPTSLLSKAPAFSMDLSRVKTTPFMKAPFVGCAVGIAAVWVPLWAHGGSVPSGRALVLTCALSLFCTANALLFDIPDTSEDRRAGIPTLPVRLGLGPTRSVCRLLISCGLLFSAWVFATSETRLGTLGLFCLGAGLFVATRQVDFGTSRRSVALWVDGALLLPVVFQYLLGD